MPSNEQGERRRMPARKSETVVKALSVLDQFIEKKRPLTLSQLASATGIHKSTMLRLCASLVDSGLLQRDGSATYRLGAKVWELALVYKQQVDLERLIRPLLQRLREETTESASFYVRDGEWRVCMLRENAQHAIRHHIDEGARLPLREGVAGRVLLAFSGEEGREYDQIRRDGYLIEQGREPYTASVAAPVVARSGTLVGALVVSGLASRFTERERRRALKSVLACCAELGASFPDERLLTLLAA